ncbi:hypothetical protein NBO_95g0001 [Nosema bombycis CQ1]|uniref:Uncharacterized protein n=1 Tax=Nosema bombycis (strain CQ1 / CVCC 102059) TaxID=578461 RepID=R0KR75_NOSB1|nr:hypothetical protein NBO_95g0001 [Nosema bombycis CQ1]|eukprot:EOB13241.1 hypothetical protein NBO_95g0001 [Nosema bombycis CQ1]
MLFKNIAVLQLYLSWPVHIFKDLKWSIIYKWVVDFTQKLNFLTMITLNQLNL